MPADPVALIVSNPDHLRLATEEVTRRGAAAEIVDPTRIAALDYDLAILDEAALSEGALSAMRARSPHAVAIVIAARSRLPAIGPTLPAGSVVCDAEHLDALLPTTLTAVVEGREVHRELERWRETKALTATLDPTQLPTQIVESALRLLRADAAILFVRADTGKLVPGAVSRPHAHRSVPPASAGRPDRVPADRIRMPTDALRRRSERLLRDEQPLAVRDTLSDGWLIGQVLGTADRQHGVLWAIRGSSRRPFADRDAHSLSTLVEHAVLALDHLRLVRDLEARLAGLQTTRKAMEGDKRTAQLGRLALEALRNLQAPLAYIRTNLRELAATEDLLPGSQAQRHLQYAFDGLTRADTVATDIARVSEGRERVPVELRQLVEAALSLANPLTVAATVEIASNAVILGHAARLAEGFAALLRNASEATGVTRIDVRASRIEGNVSVEIVDDGAGIASDVLAKIREPFFSTRGRAGLGFTSACEAIEGAGGSVHVWSRPGIGTTVTATLPVQADGGDDLAIETADGEADSSEVEAAEEDVEGEGVPEAPISFHSGAWMRDDEEEGIDGELDFSDLSELSDEE